MKRLSRSTSPHADLNAVKQAAERLMLLNDSVTSIEVKDYLQVQGYIAFLSDVSDMMEILTDKFCWCMDYKGIYLNFSFQHFQEYQLCPDIPKFSLS